MNPYLNAALQPQLAEIQRQYDISGTQQMGNATKAGAFGGSREALMAAENQRNAGLARNQAIGTGYNNAFQAAQQAQQFGANLGLQGYNQAGNLAGQQLAQEQSIANLQNQMGGQQQSQQQNVINQAVQNYATAQQYPYLQLGMLNSMLRGLPMQQASTQMYQAAPSQVSQLAGLGTAGLGAAAMYNAASRAGGGEIKGYAPGGAIPMKSYSDPQLAQVQRSPYSEPLDKLYASGITMDRGDLRNNPQAIKAISNATQPQPAMQQPMPPMAGLENAPTGDVIPQQFANGGIMAYAGDDDSDVKAPAVKKGSKGELDYSGEIARRLANLDSGKDPFAGTKEEISSIREDMKKRQGATNAQALTRFGLGMMGGPSQYWQENVSRSGLGALDYMAKAGADNASDRKLLANTIRESEAAKYQRENQNLNALIAAQSGIDAKRIGLAGVNAQREGSLAMKEATLVSNASQAYTTAVKDSFRALAADEKNKFIFESNPGKLWDMARSEVYNSMPESQRALLKLADPGASAKNPPQANPAGGAAPVPVVVTIPAKDGQPARQVQFESKEKADAFKKAAGIT
jgi:hypothetical protein